MNPKTVAGLITGALVIFILVLGGTSATYVVEPGHRGVEVMLGRVSPGFKPEGFGFKLPFVTRIAPMLIRQQTSKMTVDCYSSNLQQVKMSVRATHWGQPVARCAGTFRARQSHRAPEPRQRATG